MKSTKFDIVLGLWISFLMNTILGIFLPLMAIGFITWGIFLKGFAIAFPISTIFAFLVPVNQWGQNFAALFKAKPFTLKSQLLSTIVTAIIFGLFMSLLMTAVNAGIGPHFFGAWISILPYVLIIIYISSLIGLWTGIPLTKKICRIPDDSPHENTVEP